jgi:hypothetical protein
VFTIRKPDALGPRNQQASGRTEPLSDEDMRTPFAQILVTFAEPARLPAMDSSILRDDDRMRWIDHLAGSDDGLPDVRDMMIGGTNSFQSPLPTDTPEPTDYWLSTLPADTPAAELIRLAKMR